MTKCTKIGSLSVKCIKNRGFQGQNGQKKFQLLLRQICRNFRKIKFFRRKLSLVLPLNAKIGGSLSDKDVLGSFGDKEFIKNRGVIGWKLVQMGVFRWKRAKKRRVFLVAHGTWPKVECPPGGLPRAFQRYQWHSQGLPRWANRHPEDQNKEDLRKNERHSWYRKMMRKDWQNVLILPTREWEADYSTEGYVRWKWFFLDLNNDLALPPPLWKTVTNYTGELWAFSQAVGGGNPGGWGESPPCFDTGDGPYNYIHPHPPHFFPICENL